MLSLCHHHRLLPPLFTPSSVSLLSLPSSSPSSLHCHLSPPNPRTHNSTSTSLLLRSLQPSPPLHLHSDQPRPQFEDHEREQNRILPEDLSRISRQRNPRFPGSVDFPRPEDGAAGDRRALLDALELRRCVVADTLRVSLRASKLSINYSRNLVELLPEFVDFVLLEAVEMKKSQEFAHLSFNARVRNCIERSGVVPLVKWLKHNSMTYPQIGKLICMCPGQLQLLRHTVEWLKSIHVKGEFLGKVLLKAGPIWARGTDELNKVVSYLADKGVRKDWMGFVVSRCPNMLSLTLEELEQRATFYMKMGMNEKDFGTMVYDCPKALGYFSLEEMNRKLNYIKEFGLSTIDIGRLLAYKPQLMACSIEETWKPLVQYMYYLGIRKDGLRRMLTMKPMIFCLDLKSIISPKVQFLQDIGIQKDAIGSTLVKFPSLLTYSLYKKIRPVVIFLITRAGVKQRDIGKVIAMEPELLGCSIMHKLDINVKYFLSLGIHLRSLGEMISDFPMLLKYNVDVLRPKYRYLRRVMVHPLQDLIIFPRFFSYSLEGKIIPRHRIMVENRVNFKLRFMLSCSDEIFMERVTEAVERRRKFESGKMEVDSISSDDPVTMMAPDEDSTMATSPDEDLELKCKETIV